MSVEHGNTCIKVKEGSLLFVNNFHVYKIVFASVKKTKFNEADFAIKDFGIGNDGNPFLSVDGTPGVQSHKRKILDMHIFL
jgi:hypothetical protein